MIVPERPSAIAPEYCPSCGTEMLFSGTQPAGLAQFFCEACHYRHDRFVGSDVVRKSGKSTRSQGPANAD